MGTKQNNNRDSEKDQKTHENPVEKAKAKIIAIFGRNNLRQRKGEMVKVDDHGANMFYIEPLTITNIHLKEITKDFTIIRMDRNGLRDPFVPNMLLESKTTE